MSATEYHLSESKPRSATVSDSNGAQETYIGFLLVFKSSKLDLQFDLICGPKDVDVISIDGVDPFKYTNAYVAKNASKFLELR